MIKFQHIPEVIYPVGSYVLIDGEITKIDDRLYKDIHDWGFKKPEPIKITTEILQRCGFTNEPDFKPGYSLLTFSSENLTVQVNIKEIDGEEEVWIITIDSDKWNGNRVHEYLHELQDICFRIGNVKLIYS